MRAFDTTDGGNNAKVVHIKKCVVLGTQNKYMDTSQNTRKVLKQRAVRCLFVWKCVWSW